MTPRCNTISAVLALCLVAALAPCSTKGARILGFFATDCKSHVIIHTAVVRTLAEAGHNVTIVSTWPNMDANAPYRHIHINRSTDTSDDTDKELIENPSIYSVLNDIAAEHNATLAHPTMQQFLRDNGVGSFDLLVLGYYMNDLHIGLGAHFQCHVVLSFMVQPNFALNRLIGNPAELAYVPAFTSGLQQPMNFVDRLLNFKHFWTESYMAYMLNYFVQQSYDYHFPSHLYPTLDEVKANISLVLSNHHFTTQGPIRPNVPGLIEIGGIQIKQKPEPLPSDIAKVLDESKNGVIYFSFGTYRLGSMMPAEKLQIIFDVLSKLPYEVLWKWDEADFPGTADNIFYKSWLPQDDILAHPNVKLFMTHGGQGSVVESQYHGVPMLGLPFLYDQPANMASVERQGFGLALQYLELTEHSLRTAILDVLLNPKYTQAVKSFSNLYRDRPMTPHQLTVYWVEYVLRHKGAKHLQSPAIHMNAFQLLSLDVIGFQLFVIYGVFTIFSALGALIKSKLRANRRAAMENST